MRHFNPARAHGSRLDALLALAATTGSGSTVVINPLGPNASWLVANWYIDPQHGSDNSNGLSPGTALATFRRLAAIWGTVAPVLRQATTIHFLSDQADGTDPVVLEPLFAPGGSLFVVGVRTTVVATGTLSGVVAKDLTTSPYRLQANLGASGPGSVGLQVINTSKGSSVATIDAVVSGNTLALTQPMVPNTPASPTPYSQLPAWSAAWANGDSFQIVQPTKVYLARLVPGVYAPNPTTEGNVSLFVGPLWCPDTLGVENAGASTLVVSQSVVFSECRIDAWIAFESSAENEEFGGFANGWAPGGGNFLGVIAAGGSIGALTSTAPGAVSSAFGDASVDGGTILYNNVETVWELGLGGAFGADVVLLGTLTVSAKSVTVDNTYGVPRFGGSYTINPSGEQFLYHGTAVATFLGAATLTVNSQATANALNLGVSPGQILPARTLSAAQLDATIGSGGFGGAAYGIDLRTGFFNTAAIGMPAPSGP